LRHETETAVKLNIYTALFSCALLSVVVACDPEQACEPGFRATFGSCVAITPADAGKAKSDSGGDDDGGAGSCEPYARFGDACQTNDQCGCGAPTCMTDPLFYCSVTNCMGDTTVCPPGWNCLDVSQFSTDPSVTSICFRP
jgi:hypothetical protein